MWWSTLNLKLQMQPISAVKEAELMDVMEVTFQSHHLPAETVNESNSPTKCTLATCPLEVCNHQSYLSYPPAASDGRSYLSTSGKLELILKQSLL